MQPDNSGMLLRRVPARKALELGSRFQGQARQLVGKTFDHAGKQWIVADIAPSSSSGQSHTVAYVFDSASQTRVHGKLKDTCIEMEVRLVVGLVRDA